MLTHEENELLTRVGPGTPMGDVMRRYWIPALLSAELPRGGDPKRVRLLGENLVAFRDREGRVALLDENCPHRGASLAIARVEDCAVRCLYHGWLIGSDGAVRETPNEPEAYGFRDRVRARLYPTYEAGGFVWAYLGPASHEPQRPDFEFTHLPIEHVHTMKVRVDCNYAQVIEGVIDSSHSNFLHADSIKPTVTDEGSSYRPDLLVDRPSNDGRPKIDVKNTPYGFRYAAIRVPTKDPETRRFVRVTLWMAPFWGMFPAPRGWGNVQAMVPIDDTHTMFNYVKYRYDTPISPEERAAHEQWSGFVIGEDILDPVTYAKRWTRENDWLQDRERMRSGASWSGIRGVNVEDIAVEESMGPIFDRTKEHLGASDAAVIRMRRLLIESARALRDRGEPPIGLGAPVAWSKLRAEEAMVPLGSRWEPLLSAAGDEPLTAAAT